ncbi:uncharacterized protein LOC100161958 isoform X2 [Acyrthosiphon pisum]|uniref:Uncharacterized protein n=1 Tax=Acyrthosiphon pisum TaxID=7029 RepID=A0A8R2F7M6_ACYPI|nr:uncharacterized protein LOC100161958 isoform X2 [Acyrthosiphon pisum]|eukprot:XP_008182309.1 PREDICTED: uncharacterized protein LOC100161958 isoform X2 [Acyrthosiphon pisum]
MDTSLLWLTVLGCAMCTVSSEVLPSSTSEVSGFRMMFNAYRQCSDQSEMVVCLKSRALRMLDRAIHMENIQITDGISLVKKSENNGRSLEVDSSDVAENVIPENSADFGKQVDSMLYEKLSRFARSRSLQLSMPQMFDEGRDLDDGRKKKKDKGGQVYLMMLKGGLLAMAYKGLALLAGKALLVSKIALTLAILVAFKKLFSGGGGHGGSSKTTYEIVKQPVMTHSHQYAAPGAADTFGSYDNSGPYARSIAQPDVVPYPQLAAYRAHVRGIGGGGGGGGGGPMVMSSAASSPSGVSGGVQHESGQRDEAL